MTLWHPYTGLEAVLLATLLFALAGGLAYLGTRLQRPIGVERPGWTVGILLAVAWLLAVVTWIVAVIAGMVYKELIGEAGPATENPIHPITIGGAVIASATIAFLSRRHGIRAALGDAILGTVGAVVLFEFVFDLIVMGRTNPPPHERVNVGLFFALIFLIEILGLGLVSLSPRARLSRYTMFSLAALLLLFGGWALYGFAFPSTPATILLNSAAKVASFAAAITLFIPAGGSHVPALRQEGTRGRRRVGQGARVRTLKRGSP